MLKIVSNTTPLNSLLKIDKLTILKELYSKIIIPQEVYNELEKGKFVNVKRELNPDYFVLCVTAAMAL